MDAIISYCKKYINSIILNLKIKILDLKKIIYISELPEDIYIKYYSNQHSKVTDKDKINQYKTEIHYLNILLDIISRLNVKISKSNYYITCLISGDINSLNENNNINNNNFINNYCELYIQSKIYLKLKKLKNEKCFNDIKNEECLNYIKKELKEYTDITTSKLNLESIKLNELNLITLNFIANLNFEIKKAFNFNTDSFDNDLSINIANLEETSKYSKNK